MKKYTYTAEKIIVEISFYVENNEHTNYKLKARIQKNTGGIQ